jgi:hypothetical protein
MHKHDAFGPSTPFRPRALRMLAWAGCAAIAAIHSTTPLAAQSGGTGCQPIVDDPTFEQGVGAFSPQDASSSVSWSTASPLEGTHSLSIAINGYGNNIWSTRTFQGGTANRLTIGAHVRSDQASSSNLQFCAMVYYADGSSVPQCVDVPGSKGDKGTVTADLPLDHTKPIDNVNIRLVQEGSAGIRFTLDSITSCLDVVTPATGGGGTGDGGGGGGGDNGGGGGGGSTPSCAVNPNSAYPGFVYPTPTSRPYISLAAYTHANQSSTAFTRLRNFVDNAIAGHPEYGYSGTHAMIMYRITGQAKYLTEGIARAEAIVTDAETAISRGQNPALAGDSYLDIDWYLEQVALAYDYGYAQLTDGQRQRWKALGDQAIFNLWHSGDATWGGRAADWSGWATCDPGDNYHYHFLRASMLWAWAMQDHALLTFLQTQKFPPLVDYFAALPGGGTREGTGYGAAIGSMFVNYLYWKDSTGEDLANLTPHTRQTIDYWLHATVPTLDKFAPIGDQSRVSEPVLYDYHENLVESAVVLTPTSEQAPRGVWWLQHNSVNGVSSDFNLPGDLLGYPVSAAATATNVYHATGAGALFARTSWNTTAAWIAVVAGKYDQSHAHQDQGSFTFYKNQWLAVTSNIWSHSGIHQETDVHNVLRFVRGDGSTIPQAQSSDVESSMTYTTDGATTTVNEDLTNAFWNNHGLVAHWTRDLHLAASGILTVHDLCTVGSGVHPIFQLHVPVQPTRLPDGTIQAGNLLISSPQQGSATWTAMSSIDSEEWSKGYRIEMTNGSACEFNVELRPLQ